MKPWRPRVRRAAAQTSSFCLWLVFALGWACPEARAQTGPLPERPRFFNIQGRVAFPDGRPAANVLVKVRGSLGVNLQTVTDDAGRFEFHELPAGSYHLEARSLADAGLASDPVETDTTRTATNDLRVNISLREVRTDAGRKKAAVISVAEAGQKVPQKARKAFEEGLKLRRNNKADQALASFNQAIELYPEYYQALCERADLRLAGRQVAEAEADFDRALKSNPRYGPALRGFGYCKLVRGAFAEAAQYFDKAVGANPEDARAFLLMGMAYFELDRRDQAKQALQRSLEVDAIQSARARLYLANIYAREHQYQRAADELHAYLEAVPADAEAAQLRQVEAQWRARPNQ